MAGLSWFGLIFGKGRSPARRDVLAEAADRRYEVMTPEQREKYYVHPNLWTRLKQFRRP
jgi:hypothetical protein